MGLWHQKSINQMGLKQKKPAITTEKGTKNQQSNAIWYVTKEFAFVLLRAVFSETLLSHTNTSYLR